MAVSLPPSPPYRANSCRQLPWYQTQNSGADSIAYFEVGVGDELHSSNLQLMMARVVNADALSDSTPASLTVHCSRVY